MNDRRGERRARDLFEAALDIPAERRAGWVQERCGDDEELRRRVERLLAAEARPGDFLDEPAVLSPGIFLGRRLGPFELLEQIGQGGTSVVFRAERDDEQMRQTVAIKLLRVGCVTEELQRRFARERRILAELRHPFIARLLDGGTTKEGIPYVAMEFVEGLPITEYCDRRELPIEERLRLFLDVCDAVQAAHRDLIAHLDLKPANILVDDGGRPRLLDFGIAKLLESAEEADAAVTGPVRPLTLAYASPEQVLAGRVSTASDVYSLGMVLCELLAGRLPSERRGLSLAELAARLQTEGPRRASELVAGADGEAREVAARRGVTPGALARRLRGDLDTIVLKAVRAEPEARYGSVEELAADLRRHLTGMPVQARPATVTYRLRKFARRNLAAVTGMAALLIGLVAVAALSLLHSAQLERERDRAERERMKADRVVALLLQSIEGADPYGAGSGDVTAAQIVESAAADIDALDDEPEVQAALRRAVGQVYHRIGRYDLSLEHLTAALEQSRRLASGDDEGVADSHYALGELHTDRSELEEAERHSGTALEMRRRLYEGDHPRVADSLWHLAQVHHEKGEYPRARELGHEALAMQRRLFGDSNPDVARSLTTLARVAIYPDNYEEAERLAREAVGMNGEIYGPRHMFTAEAIQALLHVQTARGDLSSAADLGARVLEIARERLPEGHQFVAAAINDLAVVHYQLGEYGAAAERFRQALDLKRQQEDNEDHIATGLHNLGFVLRRQGSLAEAEAAYEESLEIVKRARGESHPWVPQTLRALGDLARETGRYADSERLYLEAAAIDRATYPEEHPAIATLHYDLGRLYSDWGDHAQARENLQRALELRRKLLEPDHVHTALVLKHLGILARRQGDAAGSERLLREALELQRAAYGDDHPTVASTLASLADALCDAGRFEEAVTHARRAVEILERELPAAWQAGPRSVLGRALEGVGEQRQADRLLRDSLAILEATFGDKARATVEAERRLRGGRR